MGLLDWLFGPAPDTETKELRMYWGDWDEGRQHECGYVTSGRDNPYVCPKCGANTPWRKVACRTEYKVYKVWNFLYETWGTDEVEVRNEVKALE